MQCGELLPTSLVFHEASAPIASVARSMTESQAIPIVENSGNMRLVGILTDQDIVSKIVAFCRDPKTTPVHEVMTADPVTCCPSDDIEYALELMRKCKLDWIPIVSCDKKLLGIINESDIETRLQRSKEQFGCIIPEITEVDAM